MKYKKRPVEIEAWQWNGENSDYMSDITGCRHMYMHEGMLIIDTLEGQMAASVGDYIIKGIKGEFYPCKSDIFEATYEKVD